MIVNAAWSPTVGGVSNTWPLAEPSCLGTSTEIEVPVESVHASVSDAVVGTSSTRAAGTTLSGKVLKYAKLFQ